MSIHDNAYSAFMLDYAAGGLSQAERLVADLHRILSPRGERNAHLLDALGGAMLDQAGSRSTGHFDAARLEKAHLAPPPSSLLASYLNRDLVSLKWRKSIFGVKTLPTDTPMASLLRLDPGERAPAHGHGRRDVTVVLCGSYADEFSVYERGDLAFAELSMKQEPRAVGDRTCVCLLATEAGRPLKGFIGLFGWVGRVAKEAA